MYSCMMAGGRLGAEEGVVSSLRAVVLVLGDDAELEEDEEGSGGIASEVGSKSGLVASGA